MNFDCDFLSAIFSALFFKSLSPPPPKIKSRPDLSASLSNFTFSNPTFIHADFLLTRETNIWPVHALSELGVAQTQARPKNWLKLAKRVVFGSQLRSGSRKRGVEFKGGSLHDGFDGFGGSGERLALLLDGSRLPLSPRILRNLWSSAGRFCGRVCVVETLSKSPHTKPQRFCRTLGAKPSFSGPANSSPNIENCIAGFSATEGFSAAERVLMAPHLMGCPL